MPAQATPVNSLSLRQHLSLLPTLMPVFAPPVPQAAQNSPGFYSLVCQEAVPLYERNCAFLI
jgi:hypothetical protein